MPFYMKWSENAIDEVNKIQYMTPLQKQQKNPSRSSKYFHSFPSPMFIPNTKKLANSIISYYDILEITLLS